MLAIARTREHWGVGVHIHTMDLCTMSPSMFAAAGVAALAPLGPVLAFLADLQSMGTSIFPK
jgi:hypothetical protein